MSSWPQIDDETLKRILWQFTSQKSDHFLLEMRNPSFIEAHSEASIFYKVLDYVLTYITTDILISTSSWDKNKDFAVQISREWIIRILKNKLQVLTGNIDIDFLISLSAEKQEKRSVRNASIAVLPYDYFSSLQSPDVVFKFEKSNQKPMILTESHAVRKQLELTQGGSLAVCRIPDTDMFYSVGVISEDVAHRFPQFRFPKQLEWDFFLPDLSGKLSCRLHYRQSSFMMPVIDVRNALKKQIGIQFEDLLSSDTGSSINTCVVESLVEATSQCTHGAIIILAPESSIKDEADRLTTNKRGISLSPFIPLIDSSGNADVQTLIRLSSIDGAILADFEGNCYAFGVILDGIVILPGNPDRGSRLNSTKAYVDSKVLDKDGNRILSVPPFIGIVHSDDGMTDILWGQEAVRKVPAFPGK